MIKSGKHPVEVKFEKFTYNLWKEVKLDIIDMINWLLFYKPDKNDKLDRTLHIIEVIIVYLIMQRAFFWR